MHATVYEASVEYLRVAWSGFFFLVFCREDSTSWPLYRPSGLKAGKKKKAKGGTKTSKSNGTCWANMPLPPPPMHPLPGTEVDLDHYPQENHGGG